MTPFASPLHVSTSRRRFVTFGGALILATCLTLVKTTLVALDVKNRDIHLWPHPGEQMTSNNGPVQAAPLGGSNVIAWPETLPEPAAGPANQEDGTSPSLDSSESMSEVGPEETPPVSLDPSALTEGQIQALQKLAARSQELDERERLLDMRAELNGRTEDRLDQQIEQLAALKQQLEVLVQGLDEDEELKLVRLVKIYETMKPKSAAEIFNRLEIPVLLHVLERMKEAKSAVILGKMDPAIAERVTTELAKRKQRPMLGDQDLGI